MDTTTIDQALAAHLKNVALSRLSAATFVVAWLELYAPDAVTIEVVRLADTGEYNLGEFRDVTGAEVGPRGWFEPYVRNVGDVIEEHGQYLLEKTICDFEHDPSVPFDDESYELSVPQLAEVRKKLEVWVAAIDEGRYQLSVLPYRSLVPLGRTIERDVTAAT